MDKKLKILFFIFFLTLILTPAFSFSAGLVPECDSTSVPGQCIWGFKELLALINNVVNFIFVKLVVPIAAVMFFYAGFLMITAGGEAASSRTKAKNIFKNAVFGLILAAAAWLIINTLLSILGYDGSWIGFKDKI